MRKLLIVKIGAIGDVLRTTSLLPGLHEKYPLVEIDWITSSVARDILNNNSFIRHLFSWEEKEKLKGYDLAIGLEDDREACELVSSINSKAVLGAYLSGEKIVYTPSAWFDMSIISRFGIEIANKLKKENTKTYQRHMADLLGIKMSPYVFGLEKDEIEYGKNILKNLGITKNEKIVGVNTGAGKRWPQKSWGIEQTIGMVNRLRKELGAVSLILGGEEEKERNTVISKETGMPAAGSHSLRHFASIIGQCRVVLSSDSLAMHFALALNRRIVVLFGPTSAAEIELYGLGEKISAPLDCITCYKKECGKQPDCMDSISVDDVFDAIKRQYKFVIKS